MNIQELLNNDIIKTNDILKLAADTTLLRSTLAELDKTNNSLSEAKSFLEEQLEDTHSFQNIRSEYSRAKEYKRLNAEKFDSPDYSLKTYINWRFSINNYVMYISDDTFFTGLYYNEEDDYSLLDIDPEIGYENPDDCLSIDAMMSYFRDSYEYTINCINEAIEHTIKIKDILCKLAIILKSSPNIVAILKMATM